MRPISTGSTRSQPRLLAHEQLSGRVLDLMSGPSRYFDYPHNVVAADVSGAVLAKNKSPKRVQCSIDSGTEGGARLPFRTNSFDAVTIVHGIAYLKAVDKVLTEAKRVLKPGGKIVIIGSPWFRASIAVNRLSARQLSRKLAKLGLETEVKHGVLKADNFLHNAFRLMGLERWVDVPHYVVTGVKNE